MIVPIARAVNPRQDACPDDSRRAGANVSNRRLRCELPPTSPSHRNHGLSGGMEGRLAKAELRGWVGGPVEEVQCRPGGTWPSRGRPFVNCPGLGPLAVFRDQERRPRDELLFNLQGAVRCRGGLCAAAGAVARGRARSGETPGSDLRSPRLADMGRSHRTDPPHPPRLDGSGGAHRRLDGLLPGDGSRMSGECPALQQGPLLVHGTLLPAPGRPVPGTWGGCPPHGTGRVDEDRPAVRDRDSTPVFRTRTDLGQELRRRVIAGRRPRGGCRTRTGPLPDGPRAVESPGGFRSPAGVAGNR